MKSTESPAEIEKWVNRDNDLESNTFNDYECSPPTHCTRFCEVRTPEELEEEIKTVFAKGLIHPKEHHYDLWHKFLLVWVVYSAFISPFQFAFINHPPLKFMLWDLFVNILFAIDIVLTFFVPYRDEKTLVLILDKRKIALRYLCHGAAFDILSSIPYNLISYIVFGHAIKGYAGDFFRFLAVLRLYRIASVYSCLSLFGRKHRNGYMIIRLVKLFVNIILAAHFAAVAYFYLATVEPNPENTWIGQGIGANWKSQPVSLQYVASIYWSLFLLTSIGPSYEAITTAEQLFCCVYSLFGMGALAYTLGTLTVLVVKGSSKTLQYHEDIQALNRYAARNNLPGSMEAQLRKQLNMHLQLKKTSKNSFLNELPRHLRVALSRHLYLPIVSSTEIFQRCSKAFLNQVVCLVEEELVMPNTVVMTQGDVASHLYIVASGSLIRENSTDTQKSQLRAGSAFGKIAVICNRPQLFTVKSSTLCQLLKIPSQVFCDLLRSYPSDSRIILDNLKKKVEGLEENILNGISPSWSFSEAEIFASEVSALITVGDSEFSFNVCNASASGNVEKLKAIVTSPSRANCVDYNGRTPLHIASANGHVDAVNLLIHLGADVNALDRNNSSPLLEAVKRNYQDVQEILLRSGAHLCLPDEGNTLCQVVASGNVPVLERYLLCRANPNAKDFFGRTPVHVACHQQQVEALKILLDHGGDISVPDSTGQTPLDLAVATGNDQILEVCMLEAEE